MTRIISGLAGGRRLRTLPGATTRPTSDRVREAIFSIIGSWSGSLDGLRVLDLYAGSGALGLEAWSRGAGWVEFVERDRRAAAVIAANIAAVGCPAARLVTSSVRTYLTADPDPARRSPHEPGFDLVLIDPPYGQPVSADLAALAEPGWLRSDALVVVERATRDLPPIWPVGYHAAPPRKYGETTVWLGHTDP